MIKADRSYLLLAALFVAFLGTTRPAAAQNEEPFLFGDQAALTGGAVVATAQDTAAIWYNPAGLGQNERGRIEISATAFTFRVRPIPDGLALDMPSARNQQSITSSEIYVVPTAIGAARQIAKGLSVGLGLFTTEEDITNFTAAVDARDPTMNLDVSGALTGTVIRYHAGPSIGWQVSPRVRIGMSVFGVYEDLHQFRKLFANAQMNGAYTSTFLQRLVDSTTSRLGAEIVGGVQLDPGAGWLLGFTFRSPRLIFSESAATDNSTALISKGPGVPPVTFSAVDHTALYAEGTGFTRPPRFTGGAARSIGPVDVSAEGELVPRNVGPVDQRAVVNVRGGALWHAAERTQLGVGVFTDRSTAGPPVAFPDYRVDYYGLSLGWKRLNTLHLRGEAASSLTFSTTIALRYALGFGQSTRIRFDFRDAPTNGTVARVDGELVDILYHELSLYLGTGFEF